MRGFSLIEILVSLFIVCLVAVNIAGLQKLVGDQGRDNFSHLAVIKLVTKKFEEAKQSMNMQDIINLNGTTSTYTEHDTSFLLAWHVGVVSSASMTSPIREVQLTINWPDAKGEEQTFIYSELISLMMLLKGAGGEDSQGFAYQIPNLLNANNINYFNSKMDYNIDAYVIYNSQLFQATEAHSSHHEELVTPVNTQGVVADGWQNLGQIDNPALASLFSN
tara:strand:+ start:11644 stop:12303 length:660 start_codon:yes stop_codon:yes gene_type:complete